MNTVVRATLVALLFSSSAVAAGADGTCRLNIASAPLDEVLPEIGRQCSVQILYYSEITAGKSAPRLTGEYTLDDALHRLLDDVGLLFRRVNATTFEIRQADAPPSPSARVARSRPVEESELREVVINGTAQGLVATRIETPLSEIPQSLSVIPREQMRQQNYQSVVDAMRNAVGITPIQRDSSVYYLYSRGFGVGSYALDGGGGLRSTAQTPYAPALLLTPDISEFDHIEVLRGSNALFGADGSPGGAINLVRKRPLSRPAVSFSASAGSWNNYRQEADITGPLAFDGALRGRLVVSNGRREFFYDDAYDKRRSVYAVLDYDLTDSTVLTVGGSYSKDTGNPFEIGVPLFSDGSDSRLPRDTSFVFDWTRSDRRIAESFVRLEQSFGDSARLRVNATYFDNSVTYLFGRPSGALSPVTRKMARVGGQYTLEPSTQNQLNLEATLTGRSRWGSHGVDWVFGADYIHASSHVLSAQFGNLGPIVDPYDFDPSSYPSPFATLAEYPTVATAPLATAQDESDRIGGVFASLRMELTEPWSLTMGLRLSEQDGASTTLNYWSGVPFGTPQSFENERTLTPYLGTIFQLNDAWSLYASYAEIYSSPGTLIGSDLSEMPPIRGGTLEGGVKGVWRDGDLNGSLSVFEIDQRNVPQRDTATGTARQRDGTFIAGCCFTTRGRNSSKGAELELRGRLTRTWVIGGGYTFNQNRLVPAATQQVLVTQALQTPRHMLRLWTDYSLPGALHRWSIGGTLYAQSSVTNQSVQFEQESYAVLSPRVAFQLDGHWQAALTVNNVLDRTYYETFNGGGWNFYGEPRSYTVRLDVRF